MLDVRPRRTLWDPLVPDEASVLLSEGGYGLAVRLTDTREHRLVGPGTGFGLPLGDRPTWADLLRGLIRLRRTRRVHDPAWLDSLAGSLDGACADEATWTELSADRVETVGIGDDLPALIKAALSVVTNADSVFLADQTVRPVPGVRLENVERDTAHRAVTGSALLTSAIDADPLLRPYCAVQPVPVALLDRDSRRAGMLRLTEPAPAHPAFPGGTFAVGLRGLTRPELLRLILENRFERGENELWYFLEHFIRPLMRTFRGALDGHEIAVCALDEHGVAFELSPEFQATGRIVVTDHTRVGSVADLDPRAGARALASTLDALSAAFADLRFGAHECLGDVQDEVRRVAGQELRHLRRLTADVLSRDNPLQRYVHYVPERQDRVLKDVLATVQERTRQRRRDRSKPVPTVVIDLDLCGIVPLHRTLDAVRAISGSRPGAPDGIVEFARPADLAVLPTYAESTWPTFLHRTGLDTKYPEVDWQIVFAEFFAAFARPWRKLRTDTVNAGLARFVWDVRDAGGRVVFCTGRRERVRQYTEEVLADGGIPDPFLLCMPDDRTRPIAELKVEKLRELGKLDGADGPDIVAIFDDLLENRVALGKEFTEAKVIAVELPGIASERRPDEAIHDDVPVISTFETIPRAERGPALSNTHSLEELQLGALRDNRAVRSWSGTLSIEQTHQIIDSILSDVDAAAARTAGRARALVEKSDPAAGEIERVVRALHHVFTRKQFFKGSRSHYQYADMRRDAEGFIRQNRPIEVVVLGFPVKQCLNRLKAFGPLPDLAELGGLARLRELSEAARAVYPPGLHLNILTDGRHFRPRPAAITLAYSRKLQQYLELVGIQDRATIRDIDLFARDRLGPDLFARKERLVVEFRELLNNALHGFEITENPLRVLDRIDELAMRQTGALAASLALFRDMFTSIVYSVPVEFSAGIDRLTWSRLVFADLYNLDDSTVPAPVLAERRAVLRRAWDTVVRYLATLHSDEELGYEELLPHRVRLTVSAARPGRCGFTYLGGSGLLPWQGTAAIERRGRVAVDFAVALLDQGFVPVYSPLLGPRQPWLMIPGQCTVSSRNGLHVDDTLLAGVRLRRS